MTLESLRQEINQIEGLAPRDYRTNTKIPNDSNTMRLFGVSNSSELASKMNALANKHNMKIYNDGDDFEFLETKDK